MRITTSEADAIAMVDRAVDRYVDERIEEIQCLDLPPMEKLCLVVALIIRSRGMFEDARRRTRLFLADPDAPSYDLQ